ncbi:MAG: DUF4190 domain-containing protein [Acidobacteria bacterium]|nr:DUF4190 domain-containing protein [Acidobacteriota bacterium]
MKKCPTCGKTFDDNMRFCQTDGTPLIDDASTAEEPAFDPYATIVGVPKTAVPESTPAEASVEPPAPSPAGEVVLEPLGEPGPLSSADAGQVAGETAGSIPVAPPDDVLDLGVDPLKTMYVSDAEMKEVLGTTADGADTPAEEIKADEAEVESGLSSASADLSTIAPPPSPFSEPSAPEDAPVPPPPGFLEQEPTPSSEARTQIQQPDTLSEREPELQPEAPDFQDAPTIFQSASEPQLNSPLEATPAPMSNQEWNPPPAPTPEWQNQQIGSNTPFQPPPAGAGGANKTLAIVSLVLGILSLCCYTGVLTGIAALVTGFIALKNIKNDPQTYGGKGLAIGGMIAGGAFAALWIIYWIVIIVIYGGMIAAGGMR